MTNKLPYHKDTAKLIERMCRNVEREDFVLDKKQGVDAILKTYDLFGLERPKRVVWCKDVFAKKFEDSDWSAGSAGSARSAWSAGSAWSAWSAWSVWSAGSAGSAGSAWSAWSAWSAGSARSAWGARSARSARSAWGAGSARSARSALDYDFDLYVYEFEYCKNPDEGKEPNKNDRMYLEYCELLMQAKEYGIGYRFERKDTLYLVPTPLVKIDELNRFHSLSGPAIRWKGGAEIYIFRGVRVDKKIVLHPERLTKKDWMNEENQEVRRVIQERMGERFVKAIGSKEIHRSSRGILVEVDISPDPERVARYVEVKDASTARKYFLRVPPSIQTADEAVSWTFGLDVGSYKPEQET